MYFGDCRMRIKIVSGTDNPFLRSDENHRHYAGRHDYAYEFDTTVYPDLPSPHFRKLHSVQHALDGCDWVFWLDDDAYFTNMPVRLEEFLRDIPDEVFLVICASPINLQGGWTFLSSGQFFLRNTLSAREFLHKVMSTPIETASQSVGFHSVRHVHWRRSGFDGLCAGHRRHVTIYEDLPV